MRVGEVYENPTTGERSIILTDPFEHPERVLVAHLFVAPGGRVSLAHRHPEARERFHVLSGQVGFKIGGTERTLGPGEAAEIPVNTVHDWWQVGEEEANVVVEVDPGERFAEMVGTFFGLARDGKVDAKGMPHLLQLAVTASAYRDTMVPATPPEPVQRLMFGVLAPLGRALGRKPTYPEYLETGTVVEPDPAALALLDQDGRLRFGAEEPVPR
jgi:mannose-6-phosphate isomerase-like protein (cupin superfamily)